MTNSPKRQTLPPGRLDFDRALIQTDEEMRRSLKNAPPIIRALTNHLAKAGGKKIRAKALLACALQSDGLINGDAVKAAAAIELLHLATLVHDDIIDDASKRRGIETLHKKFGEKAAVLCGDYLLCLALQLVSSIESLDAPKSADDKTLPGYLSDVCLGELRQDYNLYNLKLSEREYFRIISGKTAALFEASFHTGFLFSDEPEEMKSRYITLGKNIGIIFQLADDCSDYEASEKTSNKPVLFDFTQGVITLPLIYALKADETLPEKISRGISPQELKTAVIAGGGLRYTRSKILRYHSESTKLIANLETTEYKRQLLASLLGKASGVLETQNASPRRQS